MKQPRNYKEWVEQEGGIEHPTHIETLQQPEQQARIEWIKNHIPCGATVLDMGCNWGYVSNMIGATTGVDINIENIDKAMREFPHIHFIQGDITEKWQFFDGQYDVVVMADVLEHISKSKVPQVLFEADRVAKKKILVTLPWRFDEKYACCFKHKWIPTWENLCGLLGLAIVFMKKKVIVECDGDFMYLEVVK